MLQGITRRGPHSSPQNPAPHSPLTFNQNRLILQRVHIPTGEVLQEVVHEGNIMCTHGLDRLVSMLASDAGGASAWASSMAIGTGTTAAASTQNALINSTGIVQLGGGSMVASRLGALTLQYAATFASDNPAGAAQINEVGVFCTNAASASMAARSVLGTDSVNKGASDEIRLSYQIIASTAA